MNELLGGLIIHGYAGGCQYSANNIARLNICVKQVAAWLDFVDSATSAPCCGLGARGGCCQITAPLLRLVQTTISFAIPAHYLHILMEIRWWGW
jgi:hypothetical protein